MARMDERDDAVFYSVPRMLQHLDACALETINALYQRLIRKDTDVLDLMASYDSHLQGCSLQSLHALGLVVNSRIRMKYSFHPVNHVAKADFRSGFIQLSGLLSSCGSGIEKEMVT